MKNILLILILFIHTVSNSQSSSDFAFITGQQISAMAIKDNFLYYGTYDGDYIRKIDLSKSPYQTFIPVVTGISGVKGLFFIGNDLYIAQFNGGKIKKIDVSQTNPTIHTFFEGVGAPSSFVLHNNYLYIAEAYGYQISRIDLNQTNPVLEIVVDFADGPFKIQLYNNHLYIAETYGDLISKIDLNDSNTTKETVIDNINNPYCIGIKNDILYYHKKNYPAENTTNPGLYKINLSESNPNPVNTNLPYWGLDGLAEPWIIDSNNTLYKVHVHGWGLHGIIKYDLNTLSVNEDNYKPKISFSPNPAFNHIIFNNLNKKTELKIINILGEITDKRVIYGDERVNIENLESGIYFIKIDNYETLKLVKK